MHSRAFPLHRIPNRAKARTHVWRLPEVPSRKPPRQLTVFPMIVQIYDRRALEIIPNEPNNFMHIVDFPRRGLLEANDQNEQHNAERPWVETEIGCLQGWESALSLENEGIFRDNSGV